ncbi:hypothetical protein [Sphingomonas sp. S2-65]|uniref:hypothetical protein n=1 Tax=Sphingomonas sp. S2-65 TaxID=2903960 RepID=UPI001F2946EC|nr:hypothetical protein [Sphingomonas sp. S2-65]UYY57494.1 hypothetical protein LZ586_12560 [Sphingomonas sp. S2-65]
MANIGAIVGGGFDLMRRRPGAVLCWGALSAVGGAVLNYAQLRVIGAAEPGLAAQWAAGGFGAGGFAASVLFGFLSLALSTILSAAAFRAVLWPEDRGLASLRLSMDEVRMIGLTLILYVLSLVFGLIGGLGIVFLGSLAGLLSGGNAGVATALTFAAGVGLMCLIVFVLVRLSVVYPLVLVRRRISLDAAWDLTRGHFWSLLGAYVLIALMTMLVLTLAVVPLVALGLQSGEAIGRGGRWMTMFQPMGLPGVSPTPVQVVAMLVVGTVIASVILAMWSGGVASAAKDLLARRVPAQDEPLVEPGDVL